MRCEKCGKSLDANALQCPVCGTAVKAAPPAEPAVNAYQHTPAGSGRCPKCGKSVGAGMSRCPVCGQQLRAETVPTVTSEVTVTPPTPPTPPHTVVDNFYPQQETVASNGVIKKAVIAVLCTAAAVGLIVAGAANQHKDKTPADTTTAAQTYPEAEEADAQGGAPDTSPVIPDEDSSESFTKAKPDSMAETKKTTTTEAETAPTTQEFVEDTPEVTEAPPADTDYADGRDNGDNGDECDNGDDGGTDETPATNDYDTALSEKLSELSSQYPGGSYCLYDLDCDGNREIIFRTDSNSTYTASVCEYSGGSFVQIDDIPALLGARAVLYYSSNYNGLVIWSMGPGSPPDYPSGNVVYISQVIKNGSSVTSETVAQVDSLEYSDSDYGIQEIDWISF